MIVECIVNPNVCSKDVKSTKDPGILITAWTLWPRSIFLQKKILNVMRWLMYPFLTLNFEGKQASKCE